MAEVNNAMVNRKRKTAGRGHYAYTFNEGDGKLRSGYTTNPKRRKMEWKRQFPKLKNFRATEYPTESEARASEKRRHAKRLREGRHPDAAD